MDEGFSGVARTWSDGASGGDLVTFFLYLGVDVSSLNPDDRLAAFEDALATHPGGVWAPWVPGRQKLTSTATSAVQPRRAERAP